MKKIYISADIEGMEGVVSKLQIVRGQPDYGIARKRSAEDVNAAVQACVDHGVEEIVVCDGHGDMENIILEDLHPRAKLISGALRSSLQMQLIEEGFDGFIAFGHAGAGVTINGVLDHCYNGRTVYNLRLNGQTINTETLVNAAIAGHYGVPLIAAIGDQAFCDEVSSVISGVETVAVKRGLSRYSAISIHPSKAREEIYTAVTRALTQSQARTFVLSEPVTMEIDFKESNMAETAALVPGVERLSSRSIRYTGDLETVAKLQELLIFRLVTDL